MNHYHLVVGHANSAGEETSIILSSRSKEGSKISSQEQWNGREGKQELTEPRLHMVQQLLRCEKEESGLITAPHSATAPESQSQYAAYSKISPSEMARSTQFCISTTGEISNCNLSSSQSQVEK